MIRLFINWYNDKNPLRAAEFAACLEKNLYCETIDEVVNISNVKPVGFDGLHIEGPARLSFQQYFEYINQHAQPGDISIIANMDMYFDDSIKATLNMGDDECYALTRYDIRNGEPDFFNRRDSQDVWIFKGKVKPVNGADFYLGVPGCDNAIAHRLQRAGYNVTNPSLTIKTYHLHESNIRNYKTPQGRNKVAPVKPPYLMLDPTRIYTGKSLMYHIGMFRLREPQYYLRNMLASVCEDYEEIDFEVAIKKMGLAAFRKHVVQFCQTHKPKVVFMQLQTPDIIDRLTAAAIVGAGCKVINWTGDVRHPLPEWYISLGREISVTLFTNMNDVESAKVAGINADYLQITDDETIYTPVGAHRNHVADCIFMANHYPNRFPLSDLRHDLAMTLKKEHGENFAIIGQGWGSHAEYNLNFKQKEEAAIYRGCKIAVNCSHYDYGRYSSNRLFRIMLAGAFCLSHHYKGIEMDFEVGKHLDTWHTIDELKEKVKYWLSHDKERMAIAEAGHKHVLENHSRFKRAEELNILLEKY